jgi:hypothetical protein
MRPLPFREIGALLHSSYEGVGADRIPPIMPA